MLQEARRISKLSNEQAHHELHSPCEWLMAGAGHSHITHGCYFLRALIKN